MRTPIAVLAVAVAGCQPASRGNIPSNWRFSAHPVTLLVTNTASVPLAVRAYPNFQPPVPQPVGGGLRLGSVGARSSACITIPDTVIVGGAGQPIVWTSANVLALTFKDTTIGDAGSFRPSDSPGWSVTLPGTGVAPIKAARCAP
jgi:hypothetical protein